MKLAIYSGYTGMGYTRDIKYVPTEKYPCYFVTNNIAVETYVKKLGWIPIKFDAPLFTSNLSESSKQSKQFKIMPTTFKELHEYDYLYYTDDKVNLDDSRLPILVDYLGDSAYAIRKHFYNRPNVMYEFLESLAQPRYAEIYETLIKYISEEVDKGYKLNSNLYATGAILRNMRHSKTQNIDNDWYVGTQASGGLQCQISFFFTAQRYKNLIKEIPHDFFK